MTSLSTFIRLFIKSFNTAFSAGFLQSTFVGNFNRRPEALHAYMTARSTSGQTIFRLFGASP